MAYHTVEDAELITFTNMLHGMLQENEPGFPLLTDALITDVMVKKDGRSREFRVTTGNGSTIRVRIDEPKA